MTFPVWDNEAGRIGFAEATPAGAAVRGWGEFAGSGYLLCVPVACP